MVRPGEMLAWMGEMIREGAIHAATLGEHHLPARRRQHLSAACLLTASSADCSPAWCCLQLDSMVVGRPVFRHTWRHYWDVMGRKDWEEFHTKRMEGRPRQEAQVFPLSDDAAWVLGAHEGAMAVMDMAVPLAGGTWPDEFGGRYYPAQRGNNSALWWEVRQPAAHGADLLCH